ncbi:Sugar kinase of the NBD/HSP70 family, may contain an N-terminal HTH domain [Sphingobacterium nematocida]|uniref:Sugar kinase of the NBD/HSP70 family, may contain an N-terminal HTH domain n=1 Tax=Sphingobacterium nematocida TaxID=1513896 RepID=A0A1T5DSS1_9SPHI|nr:ROK family transcriptional regulator [Sphingobacterium nematocida]SKB74691.1 Sugar kinase of the NBD/HSP70 family, may contain an N-terminal HTH domain [Sphingobacterium nematocida]
MSVLESLLLSLSDPKQIRAMQKKNRLLRAVYVKDAISVNELMKVLGISFPTLNTLILELIEQKLLIQNERGESIGGRKPNLYQLNDGIFKVLCVEVNRFSVKVSFVDNNSKILAPSQIFENNLTRDLEGLKEFEGVIKAYATQNGVSWSDVSGVAISMPGLIDKTKGKNYSFFFESDFDLKDSLEEAFAKKVYIVNDVKLTTYAEQNFGALKQVENGLTILMDWGMALGIVAQGEIYMGKNGFSGEMGHMSFIEDGELCYCGKRGCLETVASGISLVKKASQDITNNVPTLLSKKFNSDNIQPQHIINAALEGDQYAIELITELGKNLGKAIALFVQIFNPERVVLGGNFAKAATLITNPIQQQIQTYAMGRILNNCEVVLSTLSEDEITFGLARYFIVNCFDNDLLPSN